MGFLANVDHKILIYVLRCIGSVCCFGMYSVRKTILTGSWAFSVSWIMIRMLGAINSTVFYGRVILTLQYTYQYNKIYCLQFNDTNNLTSNVV